MLIPDDTEQLLRAAADGDRESWGALLIKHRERLRRMVALRIDHRLQGRLDASDIVQDACIEASQRLDEYLGEPKMPFYLWLRFLTGQKLITLHRQHFDRKMRDVSREISIELHAPEATSAALAKYLIGSDPRPSEAAVAAERRQKFQEVLDSLEPIEREIIALRHFEQLSNHEAAQVLQLQESAASKRYIRAVKRLKQALAQMPGDWPELLT